MVRWFRAFWVRNQRTIYPLIMTRNAIGGAIHAGAVRTSAIVMKNNFFH